MTILICCILASGLTFGGDAGSVEISQLQAKAWILHTVPLPKSIEITGKTLVPKGNVRVVALGETDPVIEQACKELGEIVGLPGALERTERAAFTIILQRDGPDAEHLRTLKNSGQAYSISANDAEMRLVALTPRGLYYAAKTLGQLLEARATESTVEIPIMTATDWPDMEDRGLWGTDAFRQLRWLADRKMNIVEQISSVGVDDEGRAYARPKDGHQPLIDEGPLYGVSFVPVVLHLEQVGGKGVFKTYPNLRGQSEHPGAICYSQPEFVDVLAEWIVQLGSVPHVTDIDVWMAENLQQKGGCACPECRKTDRNVLEVRTILAAWRKARQKVPSLGLRVLTSEETENSNRLVFREIPPGVKVWYYHSLLTYNTGETPVLWRDYLADYARSGHWLGVCPNLDATVHWTSPFTGAEFVHYRMNEFVDKQVSGLIGYATPRIMYSRFNVEAAAEWSWNAKGRTPYEFALSWAARQGIRNPLRFAEWAGMIGPVEWDVYGSHWPAGEQRGVPGPSAERLLAGTLPELGYVLWEAFRLPFGDVKSEEQLDADVRAADRAVGLARGMGIAEFVHESLIAQGYIRSLKALWEMKHLVHSGKVADRDRDAAREYFGMYVGGLEQVADELPKWEACMPAETTGDRFTEQLIGVINDLIAQMKKAAAQLGIEVE